MKLLEEKEKNLCGITFNKDLLNMTSAQSYKIKKLIKLIPSRLRTAFQKTLIREQKTISGIKYITQLVKELYLEYVKNSQNSIYEYNHIYSQV
jgi:hypothetical protein